MATEFDEVVARGAALLDEKSPGWYRDIDTMDLNLHSVYDCILAQIFGGYDAGVSSLGISVEDEVTHGFDRDWSLNEYRNQEQWDELTDAWISAINDRLRRDEESK